MSFISHGVAVATPQGEVLIERLSAGDRVVTRDNGIQEISWVGRRFVSEHELSQHSKLRPVILEKKCFGRGLPDRDLMVSANHRVLITNDPASLNFEEQGVLSSAKHLAGVRQANIVQLTGGVMYVHILFNRNEQVLANGIWSECFNPLDKAVSDDSTAQSEELYQLFPDLKAPRSNIRASVPEIVLKMRAAGIAV